MLLLFINIGSIIHSLNHKFQLHGAQRVCYEMRVRDRFSFHSIERISCVLSNTRQGEVHNRKCRKHASAGEAEAWSRKSKATIVTTMRNWLWKVANKIAMVLCPSQRRLLLLSLSQHQSNNAMSSFWIRKLPHFVFLFAIFLLFFFSPSLLMLIVVPFALTLRHALRPLTTMHNPRTNDSISVGSPMDPIQRCIHHTVLMATDFFLCGHLLNWFLLCVAEFCIAIRANASVAAQDIGHICASQTSHSDETFIYFHCRFVLCTPHTNKVEHIIDKISVCEYQN